MPKSKGLGKGLAALIPERPPQGGPEKSGVREIALDAIVANPFQPRKTFSAEGLEELAASIRRHGVMQPVLVREADGCFELVAGERRLRAARLADLQTIPALVKPISDAEMMESALVENLQRQALNPIEEAEAYRYLLQELHWTQETIGERVGKSRSHIANFLRLLQLDDVIRQWVAEDRLSMAHAKLLLQAPPERRLELARRALGEGWSIRQLQRHLADAPSAPRVPPLPDVHLRAVEAGLRRRFGSKVVLRGDGQAGAIEIPYTSLDELERLLELLGGSTEPPSGFVV